MMRLTQTDKATAKNENTIAVSISYLAHLLIFILLWLAYRVQRTVSWISDRASSLRVTWSAALPAILPPHVAITCPQLSYTASESGSGVEFSSRERAIATFVFRLFDAGVKHVTLYDPVNHVEESRFYKVLQAAASPSFHYEASSVHPICISYVGVEHTKRIHRHLQFPLHISGDCVHDEIKVCKSPAPQQETVNDNKPIDDSNLRNPPVQPTADQLYISAAPIEDSPLFDEDDTLQLTFVEPQSGRSTIARAARTIIRKSLQDEPKCYLSIPAVCDMLDKELVTSTLPSEPDVLIVFPALNAPPIPVLHDFPVWQLRLTQIIFADIGPERISTPSLFQMISSAANAPKRFGR